MRGTGYTISRLLQVRALVAGAAIIAGTFISAAHGQSSGSGNGIGAPTTDDAPRDEAALAVPRLSRNGAVVALPKPLAPGDAAVLRQIFTLQHQKKIPEAIRASDGLGSPLLTGTVLADRYLGPAYRTSVAELTNWLALYPELPDAPQIHALLLTKLPRGATPPPRPDVATLSPSMRPPPVAGAPGAGEANALSMTATDRLAVDLASQGKVSQALRLVKANRLSATATARLRALVAQVLFTCNEDAAALQLVQDSLKTTARADQNSLTWYIGGLAAWRLERFAEALDLFQGAAEAEISTTDLRAAAAFWASRAWRQAQDPYQTIKWLKRAAAERTTFHGLLARRLLRMDIGLVPNRDLLTQADVDAVAAAPAGLRAFALLQLDQDDRAEAELRTLWPMIQGNPAFGRSVLLVASAAGLQDFAAQLAGLLQGPDGRFDALQYPIPRLRPAGGFRIDPALVYALTRTESNFDPSAISPAGARGLMQIMPATADWVTGSRAAAKLHEPGINLAIGQRYVSYLATADGVGDDLIRILASYNSGPGNFQRWSAAIHDNGDPLLFIEAIPVAETRDFVPAVLAASWIYAARLHGPMQSLDSLARGEFPRFLPPEQTILTAASVH